MTIRIVDSCHVETVCLLSNRKPDTKVRIDVDLEDYYRIKDTEILPSYSSNQGNEVLFSMGGHFLFSRMYVGSWCDV